MLYLLEKKIFKNSLIFLPFTVEYPLKRSVNVTYAYFLRATGGSTVLNIVLPIFLTLWTIKVSFNCRLRYSITTTVNLFSKQIYVLPFS